MRTTTDIIAEGRPGARPLYIVSDVARFSQANESQVRRWLKGYSAKSGQYEPFLSAAPETRHERLLLSFENLIEVALVSALKNKNLSLHAIRRAHENAEREFGPYPFARYQVFVSGKDIFMEASEQVAETAKHLTALTKGGQRAWEPVLRDYLMKIDWKDGWPVEWHPLAEVKLNPEVAFGFPNIRGVKTEIMRSRFLANESVDFIASDFGLAVSEVEMGLRYEFVLEQAA